MIDRRDFLKGLGGLCAAAGLGATSILDSKAEASSSPKSGSPVGSAVRWGMVIDVMNFREEDMDKGIETCHRIHNVPHFDSIKEEIKWIWKTGFVNAFPSKSHQFVNEALHEKPITVMCNHCESAPCVRVCPTKATFKRPDGIVHMDMHRCIGCRFCMAACPYGSRSFNWSDPRPGIKKIDTRFPTRERGVVEKCNFCAERIAVEPVPAKGEELSRKQMPACVNASGGAMTFGNLNDPDSAVRQLLKSRHVIQRKSELGTNPSIFYIV